MINFTHKGITLNTFEVFAQSNIKDLDAIVWKQSCQMGCPQLKLDNTKELDKFDVKSEIFEVEIWILI